MAPAALALVLAGCGTGGNSQGTFGAPGVDVEPGVGQRISDAPAAGVGGPRQAPPSLTVGQGPDAIEYSCPMLDVRSGAGSWQVPAPGGGLRYQASFGQLARECAIVNGAMAIKVGIEGRVVLGDKGTPGVVNVPIRIAVVHEGPNPKPIATKFFTMPVSIPQGETQVLFSVVEDQLAVPLVAPGDMERYVVYVGFDPKGEPAARPRPARPRPAASTTSTAPAASAPAAAAPATPAASSGSFSAPPASDSFGPPPSSGTFGPPPATFGPPPAQ
ncbi:MAG: hypothetical protein B7Z15_17010 [Rhizobiales bacterium 32-66-8]|nr:MAG: hypothetical protein B7Z15_17010 [Rhizobiales bacterium 32-66-8]